MEKGILKVKFQRKWGRKMYYPLNSEANNLLDLCSRAERLTFTVEQMKLAKIMGWTIEIENDPEGEI